ncbi:ABC transporter permease subunit [Elstera sp.]|jgi:putrescine transport system permease protein|uniref:ABC transporter permease subunit n=1 Tax=Elstera sp. TaxID=1916664 RepID=UPI0037C15775
MNRRPVALFAFLGLGYAFLYGPILSVIFYSFNENRLVTVWSGFSTKWYGELFRNERMIEAAITSLKIAAMSATGAVVLGTLAGYCLARMPSFWGRTLFAGLVSAPLVMPEVITGLASLLLFVGLEQMIGWPNGRGVDTITIAHITFTLSFVAVIVQARLKDMDQSIEEAAMDLGARPWQVFYLITLPLILPALVSGWLLAFTISLDDLVITSFVSGPGSSTLPMMIFSKVRLGVSPEINALATLIVGIVTTGILISGLLMFRQNREKERSAREAAGG